MADYEESAMIALLPITTDWCKTDLPHLTLVYAGELKDLPPTAHNEMAKDAAALAMLSMPFQLQVLGIEQFGEGVEMVDVLRLANNPELQAMRNFVKRWNASKYPFNPHATIGPVGTFIEEVPRYLAFDRIMIAWGVNQMTFWLKRY